ncbi:hypothetical protein [Streptomyces sp. NPDC001927]
MEAPNPAEAPNSADAPVPADASDSDEAPEPAGASDSAETSDRDAPVPSDAASDPEKAPVPAEAVDSGGSRSPETDEAPDPVPASDDTPEPAGPEGPEASADGRQPEAQERSGDRAEPDDETPELELELKPYDDSVPYSAAYTASRGAAEAREADAVPARASETVDESAPEPPAPTDAHEAPAPKADAEAAPERAEAAKPQAEAVHSAEEAPEPTAPIDAPEPQAEDARDLPAHAQNEAEPVEAHEGSTPASEAEAAEPAGAGAKTGEAGEPALPGDGNGIRQDHEAEAEPTAEVSEGEAEPTAEASEDKAERYDNSALRDGRDGRNYQQELDDLLNARGLDRSEHDKLRLSRTNELSEAQAREVVGVRDAIKLDKGRMVTKVIEPKVMVAYMANATELDDEPFNADEFRGSIARGCDTADLRSMDQLRDGLALDDGGAGWTPVPPGASEAYQLRFPAPDGMRADPALGAVGDRRLANHVAGIAGQSEGKAYDDPFLGTGYTGGGVPEWSAKATGFPHHAEIWRMDADGTEEAVGFFDKNEGLWKLL